MGKRAFDLCVSLLGMSLLLPLFLVLVLLVRIDSPGPALFRQKRVGKGGKEFEILKLRTMVVDAERLGGYFTTAGDPRITRLGGFLRRTSLDELPQLINVLKGEMSLVGPRPDTPMQREGYRTSDWIKRTSVRPGITGLAQARLRSGATTEERLALDLAYVDRPTLTLDLVILCETAGSLFVRKAI